MLNGSRWGAWKFDASTAKLLNDFESFSCDQPFVGVGHLIHCAKVDKVPPQLPENSWEEVSAYLNDLSFEPKKQQEKHKTEIESSLDELAESLCLSEEPVVLANKIYQIVSKDPKNKQNIMNILSHQKESKLPELLMISWGQMNTLEHKKTFITSVSDDHEARHWICLNIIRPWMLDNFPEASEALKGLVYCLGSCVLDTILSLADVEESFFVRESNNLKEILSYLDTTQINELVRKLIQRMSIKLEIWHLTLLMSVTEVPLLEANIEDILNLMEMHMDLYSRDRYMGRILTNIIQSQLGPNSPNYLINKTGRIINSFRGIMKTMLLRNLNTLRTQ